jgi:hypothetical protein
MAQHIGGLHQGCEEHERHQGLSDCRLSVGHQGGNFYAGFRICASLNLFFFLSTFSILQRSEQILIFA